jgi:phosphate starvation-inducible PhoH-like protein
VNDANLHILEDRFNSTISVRGDIVNIRGVLEEVELVEKVIKEMAFVLNTSGRLNRNDVETILNLTVDGKEIISEEEFDSIVLYTKNDVVKAKTPGQKNYFQK